jgi:sec-independent protein translocase protein TatC
MPKPAIKEKVMPFGEHLEELRRRLILSIWGIVPILLLSFYFGKDILRFLIEPITMALQEANLGAGLQATGPLESFMTYFKVVITVTILVASPWILYQLWMFVAPGLYANERRFAYLLAPMSFLLTVTGVTFCYKIMLPITLFFLATFGADIAPFDVQTAEVPKDVAIPKIPILSGDLPQPEQGNMWIYEKLHQLRVCLGKDAEGKPIIMMVQLSAGGAIAQQYRLAEYVSLLLGFCLAFALSFQMPVAVLLLGWANIVEISVLTKYRRHAAFACAALGAILTPTADPLTMILLAGPLYLLYEFGIMLLRVLPASRVAAGFRGAKKEGDGDADGES